jgi:hypothetical protein
VGREFPHLCRPILGPTQPPVQWVPGFSRGQRRPGRDADHKPPSSVEVKKELSYTSTHPMGSPGPVTVFPLLLTGSITSAASVAAATNIAL